MDAQPYGLGAALASGFSDFLGQHPRHAADVSRPDPPRFFSSILCTQLALLQHVAAHEWTPQVANAAENRLRGMVIHATPTENDRANRIEVLNRLRSLARSGIRYCSGLDIEPFGSFVSGLYTRTGDLDLSVEGVARQRGYHDQSEQCMTVAEMPRFEKQKFLHSLAARLIASGAQSVNKIVHARVPILKFVDGRTRVDCDVAMGSSGAHFKSTFVGLLASIDWRVGAMVRLVKVWAREHGINDSSQGTLNSFALTLLVIFHLQTRSPAILPPLHTLFIDPTTQSPDDHTLRPMAHNDVIPDPSVLRRAALTLGAMASAPPETRNGETLVELLSSFFALVHALVNGWDSKDEALACVLRRVRVDTWRATLHVESWGEKMDMVYRFSIEDPFDSTDNCARTVREDACIEIIRKASFVGFKAFSEMKDIASMDAMLAACFGESNAAAVMAAQKWRPDGGMEYLPPSPIVPLWLPQSLLPFVKDVVPSAAHVCHFPRSSGDGSDASAVALEQLDLSFARLSTTGAELLNAETWKMIDLESDGLHEDAFSQAWPVLAYTMRIEHEKLVEDQERRQLEYLARKQARRDHKEAKAAAKALAAASAAAAGTAAVPNSGGGGGGGVPLKDQQQQQQQQQQSTGEGLEPPPGLLMLPPLPLATAQGAQQQQQMPASINSGNGEGQPRKRRLGKRRGRRGRGSNPPVSSDVEKINNGNRNNV